MQPAAYSMELLRKKLKNEYGIKWSKGYLDKVLKNPFLLWNHGMERQKYPHRYPPIITKTLFDQVQQVKTGFNKKTI